MTKYRNRIRRFLRKSIQVLLLSALAVVSCHRITEVELGRNTRIIIYNTEDFSEYGEISDIPNGLSMCRAGWDQIMLISTDGILFRLGVRNCSIDRTAALNINPAAGRHILTVPNEENQVYILGSGGIILEVNRATMEVDDAFRVGNYATSISSSMDGRYLFIADHSECMIRKVNETSHEIVKELSLEYPPVSTIRTPYNDIVLGLGGDGSGTRMGSTFRVDWAFGMAPTMYDNIEASVIDLATVEEGGSFTYVLALATQDESATVTAFSTFCLIPAQDPHMLSGHPTSICSVPGSMHVWLTTFNSFSGNSNVIVIDGETDTIIETFEISGHARYIIADESGQYVLILTS